MTPTPLLPSTAPLALAAGVGGQAGRARRRTKSALFSQIFPSMVFSLS